jgi:hypothetical protein
MKDRLNADVVGKDHNQKLDPAALRQKLAEQSVHFVERRAGPAQPHPALAPQLCFPRVSRHIQNSPK